MKTTSIVAVLCLVIGFASGWLMKPETGQAPSSASDTGAGQPTRPGSRTTATAGEHGTSGPRAAGRRSGATDQASFIRKLKDDRQKRIDGKVVRMAPFLNETQQEQYRKALKNKGGMLDMMLDGMEDGE